MKGFIAIACLVLVACAAVEARPKRSVLLASPLVASVPAVVSHSVVHNNPTTVVRTEQVHNAGHSSYQYSTEVKNNPVVHTTHHAVAAAAPVVSAPVVSAPVVSTVHHTVPTYAYSYGYPYAHSYGYPYAAYSPYHYVVGK